MKVKSLPLGESEKLLLDSGLLYAINKILHPLGLVIAFSGDTPDEMTSLQLMATVDGEAIHFASDTEAIAIDKLQRFLDGRVGQPRLVAQDFLESLITKFRAPSPPKAVAVPRPVEVFMTRPREPPLPESPAGFFAYVHGRVSDEFLHSAATDRLLHQIEHTVLGLLYRGCHQYGLRVDTDFWRVQVHLVDNDSGGSKAARIDVWTVDMPRRTLPGELEQDEDGTTRVSFDGIQFVERSMLEALITLSFRLRMRRLS